MASRSIILFCFILTALGGAAGCYSSESDYTSLVAEKNSLAVALAAAVKENEILSLARNSINEEQGRLQSLVSSNGSRPGSSPLPPPVPQSYSWGGYDWTPPPESAGSPATTPSANTAASTPSPLAQVAEPSGSGPKIYKPRPGDVLSSIASRNNTTVERLVELNPYLAKRRNYMIWDTDKIVLP